MTSSASSESATGSPQQWIGKLHSIDIAQALITIISTERGNAQLTDEVGESQSTPHVNSTFRIMWWEGESKEHRRRSLQNFLRVHHDCFFFLVSRTRHHSCAGHCFTIRSHCNFFRNATIPPGRIKQQRKTKQTATKQNQQRNTNQTQTENQTPEWKLSSLLLYNIQLK